MSASIAHRLTLRLAHVSKLPAKCMTFVTLKGFAETNKRPPGHPDGLFLGSPAQAGAQER